MTPDASSYRRILWATSVIGGSTLAALLVGLVRNKAIALAGGPTAIGLVGLYGALLSMIAGVATLGLETSAVRRLSQSIDDPAQASKVRRATWALALPVALLGAAAVWLGRSELAVLVIGNRAFSGDVGWLSIGIMASVALAIQLAIMQSYGRVGDVALARLWGSVLSTIISVGAVYAMGLAGIVVAVLSGPVVSCGVATWLSRRLPPKTDDRATREALFETWRALLVVGAAVTLTRTVANSGGLAGRAIVTQELGLEAAGLYQASTAIISVNLTLLISAMTADYYPRVARLMGDVQAMNRVLNEQLHVMLVLAAPVLVVVSVLAPFALQALYSGEFTGGAFLLRLLLAACVPQLASWTLGFALLARGAGGSFLLGEIAGWCYVPATWIFVRQWGLWGAGLAFLLGAVSTYATYLLRARQLDVRLDRSNLWFSAGLSTFLLAIALLSEMNIWAASIIGISGAAALIWRSVSILRAILVR